jgi:Zn-dependent protease
MFSIKGKIPITVHPLFFLVAFLIGWINTFKPFDTGIWVVVITISVLIHEYGHALTALAFGQRPQIILMAMGGLTQRAGPKLKLWQEFLVVFNGPLAGISIGILALLFKWIFNPEGLVNYVALITIYVNFFWTFVNLLPLQPLDGGHLLSIVLQSIFGFSGVKISLFISVILAISLSILFFIMQAILAGALFLLFAFEAFRAWKASLVMTEKDQDQSLQELLKSAEMNLSTGKYEDALVQLDAIRKSVSDGIIYTLATQDMARTLNLVGRDNEAYDLLKTLNIKDLTPESLILLYRLAFRFQDYRLSAKLGDIVYQTEPTVEVAAMNALSHYSLGENQATMGWLQSAQREGSLELTKILQRPEFEILRAKIGN